MGIPQRTAWAIIRLQPGCALWIASEGLRERGYVYQRRRRTIDEEFIEEERLEVMVFGVSGSNVVEEDGLSD